MNLQHLNPLRLSPVIKVTVGGIVLLLFMLSCFGLVAALDSQHEKLRPGTLFGNPQFYPNPKLPRFKNK